MRWQKLGLAGMLWVIALSAPGFAGGAMTYDLRFEDGTRVKPAQVGSYIVKLYAVIDRGDDTYENDSITGGLVNIYSENTGGGSVVPGTNSGVTARSLPGSPELPTPNLSFATNRDTAGDLQRDMNGVLPPNSNLAEVVYVTDGILDWGADERYINAGGNASITNPNLANYFQGGIIPPVPPSTQSGVTRSYNWRFTQPFFPGTTLNDGISQASVVRPNAWEVLIGHFTITLNAVAPGGTTKFTPFSYHRNRANSQAPSPAGGANYSQDGSFSNSLPGRINEPFLPGSFTGVEFIPEPAPHLWLGLLFLIAIVFPRLLRTKSTVKQ
ncbi:MAG: hypothetical protein SFX18_01885 [Pirellulales bacterium]|nr:hypothetical protein [Pirellulales bacterium]